MNFSYFFLSNSGFFLAEFFFQEKWSQVAINVWFDASIISLWKESRDDGDDDEEKADENVAGVLFMMCVIFFVCGYADEVFTSGRKNKSWIIILYIKNEAKYVI